MKEIIEKLQALIYGNKNPISETRNSVIIEDSESLNKMIRNAKRSWSCKKLIEDSTCKSRMRGSSKNYYSEAPVCDYSDTYRPTNQSSVLTSNNHRVNNSMNPIAFNLCNKSQIKSVKVYKLNSTDRENKLHQNLKTSRKTHKISSKIFKKFLKDYQEKVSCCKFTLFSSPN